jgi:hypothetical protein
VHAFQMDVRSDESVEKARKLVEDTVGKDFWTVRICGVLREYSVNLKTLIWK